MNIYIMRHGLAAKPARRGKDSERQLTRKGERKLWDTAEAMEKMGLTFQAILSSPYLRARQTADIIADAFNARKHLKLTETLAPGRALKSFVAYVKTLSPPPENLLLVGHEPGLSEFISLLVCGDRHLQLNFKKGGLCKLTARALTGERCATLEWLLTPKQMRAML